MYLKLSTHLVFLSQVRVFLFSLFLALLALVQTSNLEAGGWGKTEEVFEHGGVMWNRVYFDMNQLNFSASLPNYSGTLLQNGVVFLKGCVNTEANYVINTSLNANYTPPKLIKEFVEMVQEANPDYIVHAIDSKKLGAKYGVDLIPINQETTVFWRFLSTNNHIIMMGTDDVDEQRRFYFFENLSIH